MQCVKKECWPQGNQGQKNRTVKQVNRIGNEIQIRGKETLNRKVKQETKMMNVNLSEIIQ